MTDLDAVRRQMRLVQQAEALLDEAHLEGLAAAEGTAAAVVVAGSTPATGHTGDRPCTPKDRCWRRPDWGRPVPPVTMTEADGDDLDGTDESWVVPEEWSVPGDPVGSAMLASVVALASNGHFSEAARVADRIAARYRGKAGEKTREQFEALAARAYAGRPEALVFQKLRQRRDRVGRANAARRGTP